MYHYNMLPRWQQEEVDKFVQSVLKYAKENNLTVNQVLEKCLTYKKN